jgi:hypothetical protein
LALTKDSTSPNITCSDSAGTGDPFVRFLPSTTSNAIAVGIDNTNQVFKIAYGTNAVLGTNDRLFLFTTGNIAITNSLQVGSTAAPTYELDVDTGARVTDQIGFRIQNTSVEGIYIVPYAGAAGYNNNTVLGDVVIAGTAGENVVIGAGGSNAGFRFVNSTNTITTLGNLYLTNTSARLGYDTGAGGTVTQLTNKGTGVTLNRPTGLIQTANVVLNANTTVTFVLTNSVIAATDIVLCSCNGGGTNGAYLVDAYPAGGSATIALRNVTAANLTEQVTIRFAVIKSVNS